MPSEQSPPRISNSAHKQSSEKGQHSSIIGGVRRLLGLPLRESGVLSTAPLTAPPRRHHYGQPPVPVSEENEGLHEIALDKGLIEDGDTDPQTSFPLLPHKGASLPTAIPENATDKRLTPTEVSAEQREQMSLAIPGVSTHRIAFASLSAASETAPSTQTEEPRATDQDKVAPLHVPVARPLTRETARLESEFLSRLERFQHLVTSNAKAQPSLEAQRPSLVARAANPAEPMSVLNSEHGDTDVARRLTQLQRTVNELAATVSSQAARNRDNDQTHWGRQKAPTQRIVIKRVESPSSMPRAFWERSRLGRFHLRTGR